MLRRSAAEAITHTDVGNPIDIKLVSAKLTTLPDFIRFVVAGRALANGAVHLVGTGLALAVACAPLSADAQSSPPPALWRDVGQVGVMCLVETPAGVDTGALHDRICDAALRAAGRGAPLVPVRFTTGDARMLRPRTVTLLVHAAVSRSPAGDMLAVSTRPYRNLTDDPGTLFAGAPVALPLESARRDDRLLADAMRRGLAKTLPWAPPPPVRRIELK